MSSGPELVGAARHHRSRSRRIGQVGAVVDRAQLVAQRGDLRGVAEAVEHHPGARGGQRAGDGEADARGRAGDECDLAASNVFNLRVQPVLVAVRRAPLQPLRR